MILIGQYDSPFVRRVAIALRLYGLPFEHRPWSTFGDAEKLAHINPLTRVPTLVLDNGEALLDSISILDHLDETVGEARALIPATGPARRAALKIITLATGLADKSVALFYERLLHKEPSATWTERCRAQIGATLQMLETDRATRATTHWFADTISHADIAVACALRFTREAHTDVFAEHLYPALAAHAARCEALPVFREISQPFIPPS